MEPADNETLYDDIEGPAHLRVTSIEQLEALLLEAQKSPAHEMTEAHWDELERLLKERCHGSGIR
jgi:hypothetical protein